MSDDPEKMVNEGPELTAEDSSPEATATNSFISLHSMLVSLEAKEAGISIGTKLGLLIGAAMTAVFAYCLIMVGLIGWLGVGLRALWDHPLGGFAAAALTVGLLHLLAGGLMVWKAGN